MIKLPANSRRLLIAAASGLLCFPAWAGGPKFDGPCKQEDGSFGGLFHAEGCYWLGPDRLYDIERITPSVAFGKTLEETRAKCAMSLQRLARSFTDEDMQLIKSWEDANKGMQSYVCPNGTWRYLLLVKPGFFHRTWMRVPGGQYVEE
jgi:hypothetical protein